MTCFWSSEQGSKFCFQSRFQHRKTEVLFIVGAEKISHLGKFNVAQPTKITLSGLRGTRFLYQFFNSIEAAWNPPQKGSQQVLPKHFGNLKITLYNAICTIVIITQEQFIPCGTVKGHFNAHNSCQRSNVSRLDYRCLRYRLIQCVNQMREQCCQ